MHRTDSRVLGCGVSEGFCNIERSWNASVPVFATTTDVRGKNSAYLACAQSGCSPMSQQMMCSALNGSMKVFAHPLSNYATGKLPDCALRPRLDSILRSISLGLNLCTLQGHMSRHVEILRCELEFPHCRRNLGLQSKDGELSLNIE
jgi:hypothetical protein